MDTPLQITYRGMNSSNAIDAAIRERFAVLLYHHSDILTGRVVVEKPHRRHRTGGLFHVRIDIAVPGEHLVVNRNPSQHVAHADFYVALRDAFRAARRELVRHSERRRHEVKRHSWPRAVPLPTT